MLLKEMALQDMKKHLKKHLLKEVLFQGLNGEERSKGELLHLCSSGTEVDVRKRIDEGLRNTNLSVITLAMKAESLSLKSLIKVY